jgi:hypothetical protein
MLNGLGLSGHFEIMDFVRGLLDGIATFIAVRIACLCSRRKECRAERAAYDAY